MSGPPSRPTPPSKPHSVSHEGVSISGVRVGSVLQGTRSQDRWTTPGRPCLGGHMVPGGAFSLSASAGRSSSSNVGALRARGGCETAANAQVKIEASAGGHRSQEWTAIPSIASLSERDSKISAWRSFSAGSCNRCSAAHVRASKRSVRNGSEFQFSMLGNKSLSGSEKSFNSISTSEHEITPLRQSSKLSVRMKSPKTSADSVDSIEYVCTVSPPSRSAPLGSPQKKPVLETKVSTKVSTKVTTTTTEVSPPAYSRVVPAQTSADVSNEALKSATDKQDGLHRRSVTFTDLPVLQQLPEVTKREDATFPFPEKKFELQEQQPQGKPLKPQEMKPLLGPPLIEAQQAVVMPETVAEDKELSFSELSESSEMPQKGPSSAVSTGRSHTLKHHREFSPGHVTSMALVLQDEPPEEAALPDTKPQPAPVDAFSKEDIPIPEKMAEERPPVHIVELGARESESEYEPKDIVSEHVKNASEAVDFSSKSPELSKEDLEKMEQERRKLDSSALVEIRKIDRSVRIARSESKEETPLFTGTLFGPEEQEATEETGKTSQVEIKGSEEFRGHVKVIPEVVASLTKTEVPVSEEIAAPPEGTAIVEVKTTEEGTTLPEGIKEMPQAPAEEKPPEETPSFAEGAEKAAEKVLSTESKAPEGVAIIAEVIPEAVAPLPKIVAPASEEIAAPPEGKELVEIKTAEEGPALPEGVKETPQALEEKPPEEMPSSPEGAEKTAETVLAPESKTPEGVQILSGVVPEAVGPLIKTEAPVSEEIAAPPEGTALVEVKNAEEGSILPEGVIETPQAPAEEKLLEETPSLAEGADKTAETALTAETKPPEAVETLPEAISEAVASLAKTEAPASDEVTASCTTLVEVKAAEEGSTLPEGIKEMPQAPAEENPHEETPSFAERSEKAAETPLMAETKAPEGVEILSEVIPEVGAPLTKTEPPASEEIAAPPEGTALVEVKDAEEGSTLPEGVKETPQPLAEEKPPEETPLLAESAEKVAETVLAAEYKAPEAVEILSDVIPEAVAPLTKIEAPASEEIAAPPEGKELVEVKTAEEGPALPEGVKETPQALEEKPPEEMPSLAEGAEKTAETVLAAESKTPEGVQILSDVIPEAVGPLIKTEAPASEEIPAPPEGTALVEVKTAEEGSTLPEGVIETPQAPAEEKPPEETPSLAEGADKTAETALTAETKPPEAVETLPEAISEAVASLAKTEAPASDEVTASCTALVKVEAAEEGSTLPEGIKEMPQAPAEENPTEETPSFAERSEKAAETALMADTKAPEGVEILSEVIPEIGAPLTKTEPSASEEIAAPPEGTALVEIKAAEEGPTLPEAVKETPQAPAEEKPPEKTPSLAEGAEQVAETALTAETKPPEAVEILPEVIPEAVASLAQTEVPASEEITAPPEGTALVEVKDAEEGSTLPKGVKETPQPLTEEKPPEETPLLAESAEKVAETVLAAEYKAPEAVEILSDVIPEAVAPLTKTEVPVSEEIGAPPEATAVVEVKTTEEGTTLPESVKEMPESPAEEKPPEETPSLGEGAEKTAETALMSETKPSETVEIPSEVIPEAVADLKKTGAPASEEITASPEGTALVEVNTAEEGSTLPEGIKDMPQAPAVEKPPEEMPSLAEGAEQAAETALTAETKPPEAIEILPEVIPEAVASLTKTEVPVSEEIAAPPEATAVVEVKTTEESTTLPQGVKETPEAPAEEKPPEETPSLAKGAEKTAETALMSETKPSETVEIPSEVIPEADADLKKTEAPASEEITASPEGTALVEVKTAEEGSTLPEGIKDMPQAPAVEKPPEEMPSLAEGAEQAAETALTAETKPPEAIEILPEVIPEAVASLTKTEVPVSEEIAAPPEATAVVEVKTTEEGTTLPESVKETPESTAEEKPPEETPSLAKGAEKTAETALMAETKPSETVEIPSEVIPEAITDLKKPEAPASEEITASPEGTALVEVKTAEEGSTLPEGIKEMPQAPAVLKPPEEMPSLSEGSEQAAETALTAETKPPEAIEILPEVIPEAVASLTKTEFPVSEEIAAPPEATAVVEVKTTEEGTTLLEGAKETLEAPAEEKPPEETPSLAKGAEKTAETALMAETKPSETVEIPSEVIPEAVTDLKKPEAPASEEITASPEGTALVEVKTAEESSTLPEGIKEMSQAPAEEKPPEETPLLAEGAEKAAKTVLAAESKAPEEVEILSDVIPEAVAPLTKTEAPASEEITASPEGTALVEVKTAEESSTLPEGIKEMAQAPAEEKPPEETRLLAEGAEKAAKTVLAAESKAPEEVEILSDVIPEAVAPLTKTEAPASEEITASPEGTALVEVKTAEESSTLPEGIKEMSQAPAEEKPPEETPLLAEGAEKAAKTVLAAESKAPEEVEILSDVIPEAVAPLTKTEAPASEEITASPEGTALVEVKTAEESSTLPEGIKEMAQAPAEEKPPEETPSLAEGAEKAAEAVLPAESKTPEGVEILSEVIPEAVAKTEAPVSEEIAASPEGTALVEVKTAEEGPTLPEGIKEMPQAPAEEKPPDEMPSLAEGADKTAETALTAETKPPGAVGIFPEVIPEAVAPLTKTEAPASEELAAPPEVTVLVDVKTSEVGSTLPEGGRETPQAPAEEKPPEETPSLAEGAEKAAEAVLPAESKTPEGVEILSEVIPEAVAPLTKTEAPASEEIAASPEGTALVEVKAADEGSTLPEGVKETPQAPAEEKPPEETPSLVECAEKAAEAVLPAESKTPEGVEILSEVIPEAVAPLTKTEAPASEEIAASPEGTALVEVKAAEEGSTLPEGVKETPQAPAEEKPPEETPSLVEGAEKVAEAVLPAESKTPEGVEILSEVIPKAVASLARTEVPASEEIAAPPGGTALVEVKAAEEGSTLPESVKETPQLPTEEKPPEETPSLAEGADKIAETALTAETKPPEAVGIFPEVIPEAVAPLTKTEAPASEELAAPPEGTVLVDVKTSEVGSTLPEGDRETPQAPAEEKPSEETPSLVEGAEQAAGTALTAETKPPEAVEILPEVIPEAVAPLTKTETPASEEIAAPPEGTALVEVKTAEDGSTLPEGVKETPHAPAEEKAPEEMPSLAEGSEEAAKTVLAAESKVPEAVDILSEVIPEARAPLTKTEAPVSEDIAAPREGTPLVAFKTAEDGSTVPEGVKEMPQAPFSETPQMCYRPFEVTNECFIFPQVTGGLLEFGTGVTDSVISLRDVFSDQEMTTKQQIVTVLDVESQEDLGKPIEYVNSEAVSGGPPEELWIYPNVTGGLLEAEAEWAVPAYKQVLCTSDTKALAGKTPTAEVTALDEVKPMEHVNESRTTEESETMTSLSGAASATGIDISGVLAEKLLSSLSASGIEKRHDASPTELEISRSKQKLTDNGEKPESLLPSTSDTKLVGEKNKHETEVTYSAYTTPGTVHFVFRAMVRELLKTPTPSAPVTNTMKSSPSNAASENVDHTAVGEQEKKVDVDAGLVHDGLLHDSNVAPLDLTSAPVKAGAEESCSETKLLLPPQDRLEVELGFVPSTETEAATGVGTSLQSKPSTVNSTAAAASFEGPLSSQTEEPSGSKEDRPVGVQSNEQKNAESGFGGLAGGAQTMAEEAESVAAELHGQENKPAGLGSAPPVSDITDSSQAGITSCDAEMFELNSARMQAKEATNIFGGVPLSVDGHPVDVSSETTLRTEPPFLTYQKHKTHAPNLEHEEPHVRKDKLEPEVGTELPPPLPQGHETSSEPHAETEIPVTTKQHIVAPGTRDISTTNMELVEYEDKLLEREVPSDLKEESKEPLPEDREHKAGAAQKTEHEEPHLERDLSLPNVESDHHESTVTTTRADTVSAVKETLRHEGQPPKQELESDARVKIELSFPQDQISKAEFAPAAEYQLPQTEDSSKADAQTETPITTKQSGVISAIKEVAPSNMEIVAYEEQLVEREVPSGPKIAAGALLSEDHEVETGTTVEKEHKKEELPQPELAPVLSEASTQDAACAGKEEARREGQPPEQELASGAQMETEVVLPQEEEHKIEAVAAIETELPHVEKDSPRANVETEVPTTATQPRGILETKELAPASMEIVAYEGQLVEREAPSGPKIETEAPLHDYQEIKTGATSDKEHEESHVAKELLQPELASALSEATTQDTTSITKETVQREGQPLQQELANGALVEIEAPFPQNPEHNTGAATATEPELPHVEEAAAAAEPELRHVEEDSSRANVEKVVSMVATQPGEILESKEFVPPSMEIDACKGQLIEREVESGPTATKQDAASAVKETVLRERLPPEQELQTGEQVETEPFLPQDQDHKTEVTPSIESEAPKIENSLRAYIDTEIPTTSTQSAMASETKELASTSMEIVECEGQLDESEAQIASKLESELPLLEDQELKTGAAPKTEHEEPHVKIDLSQSKVDSVQAEAMNQSDYLLAASIAASITDESEKGEKRLKQFQSGAQVEIQTPLPQADDHKIEAALAIKPELSHVDEDFSRAKVATETPVLVAQPGVALEAKEAAAANIVAVTKGHLEEGKMPSGATVETEAPVLEKPENIIGAAPKMEHKEPHVEEVAAQTKDETAQFVASTQADVLLEANTTGSVDNDTIKNESQLIGKGLNGTKVESDALHPENQERISDYKVTEESKGRPENLPLESDDALPEGTPDPVAGLVDFFEDEDALSRNVPSTQVRSEDLNVAQTNSECSKNILLLRNGEDLGENSDRQGVQTAFHGESTDLVANANSGTEKIFYEKSFGDKSFKSRENNPDRRVADNAFETDRDFHGTQLVDSESTNAIKKRTSTEFPLSTEAMFTSHAPPLVTQEATLPENKGSDAIETNKVDAEGVMKEPLKEETPVAQAPLSDIESKMVLPNTDAVMSAMDLVKRKPEDVERDQSLQVSSALKQSPFLGLGAETLPEKGPVALAHDEQADFEGIQEAFRPQEEKRAEGAAPTDVETKIESCDKHIALPNKETVIAEKPQASEAILGWRTPPLVTEEAALPIGEETDAFEHGKQENLEGLAEKPSVEVKPIYQSSVSETKEKALPDSKDAVAPIMELVEYIPEALRKEYISQAPSHSNLPAPPPEAEVTAKGTTGVECNKQEDYEGIEEALCHLGEMSRADLMAADKKTAAVDNIPLLSSDKTCEPVHTKNVASLESISGWRTPPLVTEEPALPLVEETNAFEVGNQTKLERSVEGPQNNETPIAPVTVSGMEVKVEREGIAPVMKIVEYKTENIETDSQVPSNFRTSPLTAESDILAENGSAGLQSNKQEGNEGIQEALQDTPITDTTPIDTEKAISIENDVAGPNAETGSDIPERLEKARTSQGSSGHQTPPLVEEPAVSLAREADVIETGNEGLAAPECNKKKGYEGINEAQHQLGEQTEINAAPIAAEKAASVDKGMTQPFAEMVTFMSERSENAGSSETMLGWKTPPLVTEEPALFTGEERDVYEQDKSTNLERAPGKSAVEEKHVDQVLINDTEAKLIGKSEAAPVMELVEYKPESLDMDQQLQAGSELKTPHSLTSDAEGTAVKGANGLECDKHTCYEGIDEALYQIEANRGTDVTPIVTEAKTTLVDNAETPVLIEVTDDFLLPPMVTGGLLEFDSDVTDTSFALKDTFVRQQMITQITSVLELKPEDLGGMPEVPPMVTGGILEFETGVTDTFSALKGTFVGQQRKTEQITSVLGVKLEELGDMPEVFLLCPRVTGGLLEAEVECLGMEDFVETQRPRAQIELQDSEKTQANLADTVPDSEGPVPHEGKAPESSAPSEGVSEGQAPQVQDEVKSWEEIPLQTVGTTPEGGVTALPESKAPGEGVAGPESTAETEIFPALIERKAAEEVEGGQGCTERKGESAVASGGKGSDEGAVELERPVESIEQQPSEEIPQQAATSAPECEDEAERPQDVVSVSESAVGAESLQTLTEAKQSPEIEAKDTDTVPEGRATVEAEFEPADKVVSSAESVGTIEGTTHGEDKCRSDDVTSPLKVTDQFCFSPMVTGGLLEFETEVTDTVSAFKDAPLDQKIPEQQFGTIQEVKPEEQPTVTPEILYQCPRNTAGLLEEAKEESPSTEGIVEKQKSQAEAEMKAFREIQMQPAGGIAASLECNTQEANEGSEEASRHLERKPVTDATPTTAEKEAASVDKHLDELKAANTDVVDTSLPMSPAGSWAHEEKPWFPALGGVQSGGLPSNQMAPALPTDITCKTAAELKDFTGSLHELRKHSDSFLEERRMDTNVYYVHSTERCGPKRDKNLQEASSSGRVKRAKSLDKSEVADVSGIKKVTTDDQSSRSSFSGQLDDEKMFTVTESVTYQRLVSEVKDVHSLSKLPKRKGERKGQHDGAAAIQSQSFKFGTPSGMSGGLQTLEDSGARVKFTTLKAASTSTGNTTSRREKTDITDEEIVYVSSDAGSSGGRLTSVKKSSSCCLVRIDDDDDDAGETGSMSGAALRKPHFDFKANFQRYVAVPYQGELPESSAEYRETRLLAANILRQDDGSDSSPLSSDKGATDKGRHGFPHRESYDKSWDATSSPGPSARIQRADSDAEATQLLNPEFSQYSALKKVVNPPCHDSGVQSILSCTLCGQSFFRNDPTHAEMCPSYHKEKPVPEATSRTPPTPECLERYVMSVVDEDDVSDVLWQVWRDHETAILASAVWSLYRCVPNAFFIIREREKRPTSRGEVCASACIITFGDEVSFCGFFHVSRERGNTGLSRMLWNRMLAVCRGKNVCTVMPQERAAPFLDRYHFHASGWGDIIYCHLTLRQGRFTASPSAGGAVVDVKDFDLKRDAEALVEYDRSVFGFDRGYFLRVALAEDDQIVKVATAALDGRVVGYAGVQKDHRARPALRWLLADSDDAALPLMQAVVESCPKIQEVGLVGAFYTASHAAGVILSNVDKVFMEPWTLLYSKREPFFRYDRIVSLTYI